VADASRRDRGIIDTSVVIDLERVDPTLLPAEIAVSAISLAELAAGPHATADVDERARRQDRLQRTEATFYPLPFDSEAAAPTGGSTPPSSIPAERPEAPEQWTSCWRRRPAPASFPCTPAIPMISEVSAIWSR